MKKHIDHKIVNDAAKLSRISLREGEAGNFSEQLGIILDYIAKLNKINTDNTLPMSHAIEGVINVFREDTVKASLRQEDALENAPKKTGDYFGVPRVI